MLDCVYMYIFTGSEYNYMCHSSYYHLPKCVDHPDGYGCKCGPGFVWNCHMCVGKLKTVQTVLFIFCTFSGLKTQTGSGKSAKVL